VDADRDRSDAANQILDRASAAAVCPDINLLNPNTKSQGFDRIVETGRRRRDAWMAALVGSTFVKATRWRCDDYRLDKRNRTPLDRSLRRYAACRPRLGARWRGE
jgi:hypothetical protein